MIYENKKRVALIFFGLIVAILIVEGLLRILGWGFHYVQDRQSRESALSNYAHLDQAEDIQLNRAERKEFVVICLGESTTAIAPRFEFAFTGKNSWPRQLQRILNNRQDQRTFRVINKGVPSTDTMKILRNLPSYLSTYRPNIVLAMVGINDFRRYAKPPPEKTSSGQLRWTTLLSHLRTYGLVEWIAVGIKARVRGKTEDVTTANIEREGDNLKSVVYGVGLRDPNNSDLYPQTISNLNALLILIKGLPLTYSKDLQDDKKITFSSFDTIQLGLQVMTELISKTKFNKNEMKKAIELSHATATDLADWLVKNLSYTFRYAYQVTGKIISYADEKKLKLGELTLDELQKFDKKITKDMLLVLSPTNSINNKKSFGGTAPQNVKKSIQYAIKKYL